MPTPATILDTPEELPAQRLGVGLMESGERGRDLTPQGLRIFGCRA